MNTSKIFRLYIYPNYNYEKDLFIMGLKRAQFYLEKKVKDIQSKYTTCKGMFEDILENKEPYCKIVPIYIKNEENECSKIEVVLIELDIITEDIKE